MSDESSAPVEIGSLLAGKYRIDRILGQGGMGVVVAATHLQLEQRVAIKFLLGHASQNAEAVVRFSREARAATKIQSEHVVRVTDVGTLENGAPYMVMEYLAGRDLSEVLAASGALSIAEAVDYLLQACEALAEAHVAGIVHRDLKPANIYLTQRADGSPVVKVLDFGISKITSKTANEASMTKTSALMGSPLYMSPEQMRSTRDVDARSDIWALGIILFELLAGRAAFQADTMPELCARILTEPPPNLRTIRPDAPARLEAVISRCLEKNPAQRFQNVGELVRALAEFAPPHAQISIDRVTRVLRASGAEFGPHVSTGTLALTPPPEWGASAGTMSSFAGTTNQTGSGKTKVIMLGVGGLAVLGLVAAAAMVLLRRPPDAQVPVSTAATPVAIVVADAAVVAPPPAPASPALSAAPVSSEVVAVASQAPASSAKLVQPLQPGPGAGSKPKLPGRPASRPTEPNSDFGDRK